MSRKARVLNLGCAQLVRLPPGFQFPDREVNIRRDPVTGDVVLSQRPASWNKFLAADGREVPADFMTEADRNQGRHGRDPFDDGDG